MATIEVPQEWVPEGHELTGRSIYCDSCPIEDSRIVLFRPGVAMHVAACNGIRPELRRKPRLKQIVFTVAGEPRPMSGNEWCWREGYPGPVQAPPQGFSSPHIPLHREEVYE